MAHSPSPGFAGGNDASCVDRDDTATRFEQKLAVYRRELATLLAEDRWAVWRTSFWAHGGRPRRDPELRKVLARLYSATDDVLRWHGLMGGDREETPGSAGTPDAYRRWIETFVEAESGRLTLESPNAIFEALDKSARASASELTPERYRQRIESLLEISPASLTLDTAIEVFDGLDRILIEIGDAKFVCEEVLGELQWNQGSTTWITWDSVFGAEPPPALQKYLAGKPIPEEELEAARHQLGGFRRVRSDHYQAHRARMKMREKNLSFLGVLLLPLVSGLAWLLVGIAAGSDQAAQARDIALIGVAGGLGAAISGTLKARDKLIRSSDLRAFRAGLLPQVLLGAASAFLLFLLLASNIVDVAGASTLEGWAALGFIAGFSEPFVLKTIERAAKIGEEKASATAPANGQG